MRRESIRPVGVEPLPAVRAHHAQDAGICRILVEHEFSRHAVGCFLNEVAPAVVAVGAHDAVSCHLDQPVGGVVLVGRCAIGQEVAVGVVDETGVQDAVRRIVGKRGSAVAQSVAHAVERVGDGARRIGRLRQPVEGVVAVGRHAFPVAHLRAVAVGVESVPDAVHARQPTGRVVGVGSHHAILRHLDQPVGDAILCHLSRFGYHSCML